jgi:hypothetical protein
MNDQSLYKKVRPKIFRDQDYNRKEQFLPTRGRSAWSHTPSTTCEIFWTKTKGRPGPRPFHILTSRERMFGTTCAPAAALHVLVPPASRLACFTPQSPLATSRRNSSVVEPVPRSAVMTPAGLFAAAVLAAVASLAAHVALNCPIEPIPSPPAPDSRHAPNNLLQVNSEQICRLKYSPILQRTCLALLCLCTFAEIKLLRARSKMEKPGEGLLDAPEDVHVDAACSTPRRGTGGFSGCALATGRRGSGGGSSAARGCSGSRGPPTAPCSSATRTRCVRHQVLARPDRETHTTVNREYCS